MANRSIFALSVLTTFGISQAAFAESHVGGETQPDTGAMSNMTMGDGAAQTGMMSGDMMSMMQNMMKMHASRMGGRGGMMGMMDRDMMAMMMPSGDPQNMRAHMGVKLREFDSDADGALTLEEFETLHMSVVRDRMVDRFQHLDADADGQITQQEMDAAGTRMGDMQTTSDASGSADHHGSDNE